MEKPVIQPIVDELKKMHPPKPGPQPQGPPKPAEQDQDEGGGFNPDHTVPQT